MQPVDTQVSYSTGVISTCVFSYKSKYVINQDGDIQEVVVRSSVITATSYL